MVHKGWMLLAVSAVLAGPVVAEGNARAGQEKSAVCAGCHGEDGNSPAASFPRLAEQGERYLVKQLEDIKAGRRVVVEMTGITDNLSEQDMQDLAAYYNSKSSGRGAVEQDKVELGRKLFLAGNGAKGIPACIGCHGPSGKGVAEAGFPRLAGQHADYLAGQLIKFRVSERENDPNQMMRQISANMSDAEIRAVASYMSGLYE